MVIPKKNTTFAADNSEIRIYPTMINRLLIRIKVVQLVYASLQAHTPRVEVDDQLSASLESTFKLYNYLLALAVKVTDHRAAEIEAARKKYFPTEAERFPNMRFVENRFVRFLRERSNVVTYCEEHGLLSDFDTELYRGILAQIEQTPIYMAYMDQRDRPAFAQDKELWKEIFNTVIPVCPVLDTALEGKDIFWNDDLTTVLSFLAKGINRIQETDEQLVLPQLFKSPDDRVFANQLYHEALDHLPEYIRMIDDVATNWEAERIATMDKIVMATCIAEIIKFPELPVRISLNEYIELAKHYCSPNSGRFVNGILDKVVARLRAEGVIFKP